MGIMALFRRKEAAEPVYADLPYIEEITVPEKASPLATRNSLIPARKGEKHYFAEYLHAKKLASVEMLRAALNEQRVTKERIGAILVRNGFMQQDVLVKAILEFDAERIATERVNSTRIPVDLIERYGIIITAETSDVIYVGTMADEEQIEPIVQEYYPEKTVKFVAFLPEHLPDFIDRMHKTNSIGDSEEEIREEDILDRLIYSGLKMGASDIHIEPRGRSYTVFLRILSVRQPVHEGTLEEYNTITAQLKDRSRMDLAERRIGQDGGFQIEYSGKFVDLRVATVPTVEGEQAIIRILDPDRVKPRLDTLGISRVDQWRRGTTRQNGLCLICGPTGSGKTTTLNASVSELDRFGKKIYTVEDPVEYRIPFVGQVSTNHQVGLDFAKAIRNFMRADPDVIVLGEVRDGETARNAVKAADTGHLVLATLHTGSIVSSLSRLRDLGVEPYELRYILRAVLVQTLVRTVCPACAGTGIQESGETCHACTGTGYSARSIVSECVSFSDASDVDEILRMSEKSSQVDGKLPWPEMIDDAIGKMLKGETTVDELRRVFGSLVDDKLTEQGLHPDNYRLAKERLAKA